jgi:hypothetical protein
LRDLAFHALNRWQRFFIDYRFGPIGKVRNGFDRVHAIRAPLDFPGASHRSYPALLRLGACFFNDSAIRVCHPVPPAFHRSKTSGAIRRLIAILEFGDFGRPRGRSISLAIFGP